MACNSGVLLVGNSALETRLEFGAWDDFRMRRTQKASVSKIEIITTPPTVDPAMMPIRCLFLEPSLAAPVDEGMARFGFRVGNFGIREK